MKHFGRIPEVIHTDHANLTRFDYLPLERIDAKHYRWHAELIHGGSLLLYRPGTGAMHRMPDALSRNPESRDALNLARIGDWTQHRGVIRVQCLLPVVVLMWPSSTAGFLFICVHRMHGVTVFSAMVLSKIAKNPKRS